MTETSYNGLLSGDSVAAEGRGENESAFRVFNSYAVGRTWEWDLLDLLPSANKTLAR